MQNLRKSLVRNWRPVCSVVGGALSGPSLPLSPLPCFLPPAGDGPACSQLAPLWDRSLLPLFCERARSVFRLVNFLSLLLSHSLNCYLTLAPSDCPQGIRARSLPAPLPYAPNCWWRMQASGVLFCWELLLGM